MKPSPLTCISIASALCVATPGIAATTALYNFEEGVGAGTQIGTAVNAANPGTADATSTNNPLYSSNVPAPFIFDPVSNATTANTLSMDASLATQRMNVAAADASTLFDGDNAFTIEFFIFLQDEPSNFNSFFRRLDSTFTGGGTIRRFQIDFDHGNNLNNFGDIRSRWDTTDGVTQVDSGRVARGDEPIYTDFDAGQSTYAGPDPAAEGDGVNDDLGWHHVALVYDGAGSYQVYADGTAGTGQTLTGSFIMPDGNIQFGKLTGTEYGLFIDEVRISDSALTPAEFLQAVPEPSVTSFALLVTLAGLVHRRRP